VDVHALHCVKHSKVSEEYTASIFRVTGMVQMEAAMIRRNRIFWLCGTV
jgi:hypothetical protein